MKKLKVMLTRPEEIEEYDKDFNLLKGYALYPPIALTTIAANALKKVDNLEIEIFDLKYEVKKYFSENMESKLSVKDVIKNKIHDKMEKFQPDLVGIGVMFTVEHKNTLEIANIVKEKNSNTKVICGGNHSTFAYKRILETCKSIDYIFLYEGDNTFPLFLKYLKGEAKFEDLKGIAWWDESTSAVKLAPTAPLVSELDTLPTPKWNLIPLKKYQNYGRLGSMHRFGSSEVASYVMQTTRGCVAQCTFCSVRSFYGKGVRAVSAKKVLEEIDYLYNDLGIQQLEVIDDDFTTDKERTLEICNGLAKRNYNLIWSMQNGVRLGTLDDEVMHAMVMSKCRNISIGVESGNDTTLAIIRKPLTIKMLYEKSAIFQKYPELYVQANYIVGFPFETDEETMNTFKVAEDIGFDWNGFNVFRPISGTPLFDKFDKKEQDDLIDNQKDYVESYNDARKLRNEMAKKIQKTLSNPDTAAKYGDAIEEQMKETLMHSKDEDISKNKPPIDEKIDKLVYLKNLEINFIKNKNLHGASFDKSIETKKGSVKGKYHYKLKKAQNLDRAINDFEEMIKMREPNHAIAQYCLAKAYEYKGNNELAKKNMNKVFNILSDPLNKKWVEYFDKVVPKEEMHQLQKSMNSYLNKNTL